MKRCIITHNIRGLNDPESITNERRFINSLAPRADIVMLQEHIKLRGTALDNLGYRLIPGCTSWILEVALGERSWLNPNTAGKGGGGNFTCSRYYMIIELYGSNQRGWKGAI